MIHALPGMGADHRMYPAPWTSIPGFAAHDWVHYSGGLTLSDIARSMCESCHINDGDTLIGASLGGMVACEIAKIRKISRLYLVGSAVRKEEISTLLAILHPLAQAAPIEWLRLSAGKIPTELARMFADIEPPFVRAMCAAVFKWEGLGPCDTRVLRLHGKHDLVIPPPKDVDLMIDGGHLISMTHATECTEFVMATGMGTVLGDSPGKRSLHSLQLKSNYPSLAANLSPASAGIRPSPKANALGSLLPAFLPLAAPHSQT